MSSKTENKSEQNNANLEADAPKLDKAGRAYATGRRKNSICRLWLKRGKGEFTINGKPLREYVKRQVLEIDALKPFVLTNTMGGFDVMCTVVGGGLSGQAGAIRHALSRALCNFDPANRTVLKREGLLTRDSRAVERKKMGKKKARKSFQFSKR
ncbi:30S ribosomal protein S9 [Rickettsiales endosymbiont of Stachyamoeba lipophora]|uniref:30S ribosomal protein S9 n=1 Tax=Rickettsiales endosymbiont of Stachyamoeba lipophora TaxID=2486578 RepID=UPI000F652C29|nr:30S ribosomal protein S9 [Rickettsiales endosymbiont of Stachyamoeba lipophora]AZL15974.1 30S ribosomal protein S9 [Rickettsiales endosymbiont of Stachyamoeba lipophora]